MPAFLQSMHAAAAGLSAPSSDVSPEAGEAVTPAVSVRHSLASPEYIISLIYGKPTRNCAVICLLTA